MIRTQRTNHIYHHTLQAVAYTYRASDLHPRITPEATRCRQSTLLVVYVLGMVPCNVGLKLLPAELIACDCTWLSMSAHNKLEGQRLYTHTQLAANANCSKGYDR